MNELQFDFEPNDAKTSSEKLFDLDEQKKPAGPITASVVGMEEVLEPSRYGNPSWIKEQFDRVFQRLDDIERLISNLNSGSHSSKKESQVASGFTTGKNKVIQISSDRLKNVSSLFGEEEKTVKSKIQPSLMKDDKDFEEILKKVKKRSGPTKQFRTPYSGGKEVQLTSSQEDLLLGAIDEQETTREPKKNEEKFVPEKSTKPKIEEAPPTRRKRLTPTHPKVNIIFDLFAENQFEKCYAKLCESAKIFKVNSTQRFQLRKAKENKGWIDSTEVKPIVRNCVNGIDLETAETLAFPCFCSANSEAICTVCANERKIGYNSLGAILYKHHQCAFNLVLFFI